MSQNLELADRRTGSTTSEYYGCRMNMLGLVKKNSGLMCTVSKGGSIVF